MDNTTMHGYGKRAIAAACLLGVAAWSGTAPAATTSKAAPVRLAANDRSASRSGDAQKASRHVDKAIGVLHTMESDPDLRNEMARAMGVLVVPVYGQAALGVGAKGGPGVLFVKRGGTWADPTFYTLGGISVGLQAGAEGGSIALILNNQKALNSFKQKTAYAINADAGLTVLAWSGKAQASAGKGDVTVWSNTKGLLGDVAISVSNINFDEDKTAAYYGQRIAEPAMVLNGQIRNPHAEEMQRAIATSPVKGGSGSSGGTGSSSGTGTRGTRDSGGY